MLPWQSLSNTSRLFMALKIGWGTSPGRTDTAGMERPHFLLSLLPISPPRKGIQRMPAWWARNSSKPFMGNPPSAFSYDAPRAFLSPSPSFLGSPPLSQVTFPLPREEQGMKGGSQEYLVTWAPGLVQAELESYSYHLLFCDFRSTAWPSETSVSSSLK